MSVESYYTSLETRLGNALFFGGRSHLPYYPAPAASFPASSPWTITAAWTYLKSLNPFPIHRALLAMEDHLFASLQITGKGTGTGTGAKVLDAGCGTGDMAIYFAKKGGLHIHGIDLLPEKVAIARRNVEGKLGRAYTTTTTTTTTKPEHGQADADAVQALQALTIQEADYHDLRSAFEDNVFDAVYTIETLAHATDLHTVLCEFHRVLKPGGRLVLYEYDHWGTTQTGGSEGEGEVMEKVHRYGGISPRAGYHHHGDANGIANDPGSKADTTGLVGMVQQANFEQIHETDLTRNVRPLLRFLVICCFIPYVIVSVLGLEARFINTVALVVNYRRGWRYVGVGARKPLS